MAGLFLSVGGGRVGGGCVGVVGGGWVGVVGGGWVGVCVRVEGGG